ncbi:hypothetical protein [Arthrobacter bambusae]|uniref:Plasmid segregation protein ParM n=1 Tax=Arthrobacter bambusae TaxID=1338426 RepID=A0AAW8DEY7_9MICC|nr:hypothetical protein [Arthrobacter bambusae]MDP9903228.1 plasmid segregation protein ParM [Arthrobacter bambusae]MDQ0128778.1 plasmid segregation protein ParM [Arthrobacter bambusae]MDQ0180119.1 plasmid segregation protein ParM [Arthrobacter bambusae]
MTIKINLCGGIDVGNGYVKGVIENQGTSLRDTIDMPSSVSVLTRPNQLPVPDAEARSILDNEAGGTDFYNELDVTISSALVPDIYRRVFGVRSLSADGAFEEFDTVGRASKAKQPLSKALVLGVFAAKALRDHFGQHGSLPEEELQVTARAALALPISEFLRHRESYAAEFLNAGKPHLVTVENFETKVSVRITFADVQVLAEGASAQYAINSKGVQLMDAMLRDVKSRLDPASQQSQELAEITAQDVLAATNTIGIDVGEGTVNFPVFTSGRFNVEASQTFGKGYGSVLEGAIKAMEDQGLESGFSNRKELADFLQREPSALKRSFYKRVKQFVDQEASFFAEEAAEKLGSVLRTVGAMTDVAFVYGGGSGSVKDVLYPALLAKVNEMNSISAFPVLYLDSSYSRHLNREGLFIAVQAVAARRASTAAPKKKVA